MLGFRVQGSRLSLLESSGGHTHCLGLRVQALGSWCANHTVKVVGVPGPVYQIFLSGRIVGAQRLGLRVVGFYRVLLSLVDNCFKVHQGLQILHYPLNPTLNPEPQT